MKKIIFFALPLFALASVCTGQEVQDVFDRKTKATWLGLDLTSAKLIGDRERLGSTSDVMHLIESWNDLMVKEHDKFNIAPAIQKDNVVEAIDVTKEHNAGLDIAEIFSNDEQDFQHLKENDIASIVADYDFKANSGVGVIFIVDSFNKLKQKASVWVTFVNMDKKEVLFTERMTGEPGGSGLRNYWANSVYHIITQMRKKEFEVWRKKHYRKF